MDTINKHRRRVVIAGSIAVASPLWYGAARAQAREFKVLSSVPGSIPQSREIIRVYLDNVQKAPGGSMAFRLSGPEVVPFAEQFQPAAAGAFDFLFTHGAYHSGTTAIGLAIDAIAPDPEKRRSAGIFDFVDRHYNSLGLKLLAMTSAGSKGFQFVLKHPVKGAQGLKGMKVRATASYNPMVKALGGAPVVLGGGEIYSALEKGVIDAAAWALTGVADLKWYEVAKYVTRPSFGSATWLTLMNLKAWSGLAPAQQKILSDEAIKLERTCIARFDQLAREENVELKKRGMQETAFDPTDASRLEALWADGVWEVARAKNGALVDEMRGMAKKAGLAA